MFLTVGEKIRQVRQQFNLKQEVFRNFGISQHYLSMIETNKRQAPDQTLKDIYEGFVALTDGAIRDLYSFEEFELSVEEQVNRWIEEQLRNDRLPKMYDILQTIATKYKAFEYIIQIDQMMGEYYYTVQEYSMMTHYFRRAIASSIRYQMSPAYTYMQFGIFLRKIGKYDEAVSNFCLASKAARESEEDPYLQYDAQIYLGLTYQRMGEYQLGLETINHVLKFKKKLPPNRYAGIMIIKELCIRRLEGPQHSIKYLLELLETPQKYLGELDYIYNNLGWNYIESGNYVSALEMLEKALSLREKPLERSLTNLLIGHIHVEMNQYEKAQKYYTDTKECIFSSDSIRTKRLWLNEQLDLYCKQHQFQQIEQLFKELRDLVDEGKFSEGMFYEFKATIYERLEKQSLIRKDEYCFLYNFFGF